MPVELNVNLDLRDYNSGIASMQEALEPIEISTEGRLMAAVPRYYPFVEMGTLRPSLGVPAVTRMLRMARLAADSERAARKAAVTFERCQQASEDFSKTLAAWELLLWRMERPRILLKWGAVLTLIIAGVAILCQ